MAIVHPITHVSGTNSIPISAYVGASFSDQSFGNTWQNDDVFFNGRFAEEERQFEERFIKPLDDMANDIMLTRKRMDERLDVWRALETKDDLMATPVCMEEMIAVYEPVRKLAEQGRIRCFGLDVDTLPRNDFYGRITENFSCDDVGAALDEHERYKWKATCFSDDPALSAEQQHMIWKSRRTIDRILRDTHCDPTDPSVLRG